MSLSLSITLLIAILGAVLSTILGIIKIKEYYENRKGLRITVTRGTNITPKHPFGYYINIRVVNTGTRPITIIKAGLCMPSNAIDNILPCFNHQGNYFIPVELGDGEPVDFTISENDTKAFIPSQKHWVAAVQDSTGRRYFSHNIISRLIKLHKIIT